MTISILGCGWLGLPLAQELISEDYEVKGSTTTTKKIATLESADIIAFQIEFTPDMTCDDCKDFWNTDLLIINIPPGRKSDDVLERFPRQVDAIIKQVKKHEIPRVIFVSSTSVFPNDKGLVREKDAGPASRDSGKALLKSEHKFFSAKEFETTVVRFGGLYGYDRHPVYYLAGRKNLDRASAPVNMIHRDDAINIIVEIIKQDQFGEVFNACSDGHPPRKEFYADAARHFDLDPPTFNDQNGESVDYKIVSNQKLKKYLNYQFLYPNPMDYTP